MRLQSAGAAARASASVHRLFGGGASSFLISAAPLRCDATAMRSALIVNQLSTCVRAGPSFMRSRHSLANATSNSLRAEASSIPRERR